MISFCMASHSPAEIAKVNVASVLSSTLTVLPLALFAGVTTYTLHRALIFPWIEWYFDSSAGKRHRKRVSLITQSTLDTLLRRWDRGFEGSEREKERSRRLTVWADYTQLQYASVLNIVFGAVVGCRVTSGQHGASWFLVGLSLILSLAAFTSDWRLHAVNDRLEEAR